MEGNGIFEKLLDTLTKEAETVIAKRLEGDKTYSVDPLKLLMSLQQLKIEYVRLRHSPPAFNPRQQ